MSENKNQVEVKEKQVNQTLSSIVQGRPMTFEQMLAMAKIYAQSTLIPSQYRGNVADCYIALEMSQRMNANAFLIMQNLFVIKGKPSFSGQFIIAMLNACGRFTPIKFKISGVGDKRECIAYATEKGGELLEGPVVSIQMAKDEGWYSKDGSKWKTMPEIMLRYRSASFFGRMYAPEMLMGIYSKEEIIEGEYEEYVHQPENKEELSHEVEAKANQEQLVIDVETVEEVKQVDEQPKGPGF